MPDLAATSAGVHRFTTCFRFLTGVACAAELQRFGFDVVVIEAQASVGGRCRTVTRNGVDAGESMRPVSVCLVDQRQVAIRFMNRIVNLHIRQGACWIHGFNNNPIIREMFKHGLCWTTIPYDHSNPLLCSGSNDGLPRFDRS